MRKAWWKVLLSVVVVGAVGCEVDEGEGDAGTDAGQDAAADNGGGGFVAVCDEAEAVILADSCIDEFFSCFDPSGTCSVEDQDPVGTFEFRAVVWSDGAEYRVGRDPINGALDVRAEDSGGVVCAQGDGSEPVEGESREVNLSIPGGGDDLTMESDASGNLVITCPDGTSETYNAADADSILNCMGFRCSGEEI